MPCDYRRYPANWKEIRAEIRKRSGGRCEFCFAPNGWEVIRDPSGRWELPEDQSDIAMVRDLPGYNIVKIVLTVAHLDQDVTNNKPYNLADCCQRCHLKIDLPFKMKKRMMT